MSKHRKRPGDLNQRAKRIVDIAKGNGLNSRHAASAPTDRFGSIAEMRTYPLRFVFASLRIRDFSGGVTAGFPQP